MNKLELNQKAFEEDCHIELDNILKDEQSKLDDLKIENQMFKNKIVRRVISILLSTIFKNIRVELNVFYKDNIIINYEFPKK